MSGECYSLKNSQMEVVDLTTIKEPMIEAASSRSNNPKENENINQLLQYETMVSTAENKCSQLKGQLELIKQFYNNQTELSKAPISPIRSAGGRFGTRIEPTDNKARPLKIQKMVRQKSHSISTDTTGAALGTINNILSGIRESIQTPDFFQKTQDFNSGSLETEKFPEREVHGVENVKINTKSKQSISVKSKTKFQPKRSRSKATSITSSTNFKKPKRAVVKMPEKRQIKRIDNQLENKITVPVINKRSKKFIIKPRVFTRNPIIASPKNKHTEQHQDLVELYHNKAVKETKSSESDMTKKKSEKTLEKAKSTEPLVPPLNIETDNDNKNLRPKGVVSCIYNRNYTMPTISSRMKQVAKYYMNSFNIKTIPFCPATSTTASHNIGINIQQVMSMVKSKQAVGKLSPTLAYNIGLAAGKWDDNPLPLLMSSEASKHFYAQCPLSKSSVNYQHLQELAKTIPPETIEEADEVEESNSPEIQTMIITGPSGDVKVTNRKQTVWSANPEDKKCTCVVPKGTGFQQIINKFNGGPAFKPKINTFPAQINRGKHAEQIGAGEECVSVKNENTPLQNKEKKLKEVLGKLHDEFERMTKRYDALAKKNVEGKASEETLKELESLDKELNSKEEEIVMVMALYKEVLALKKQVQYLKERTISKENVTIKSQPSKFNAYNSSTTAGLLNKLLERVQHFQTHYKKR